MSVFHENMLVGASDQGGADGGGAYQISRSLRFNSSDSTYLSRTPSVAGNRKTFTISWWMKLSSTNAGDQPLIFSCATNIAQINFTATDELRFYAGSSTASSITTVAKLRDTTAWYHVVCVMDSTNATATNRLKIYINGVLQSVTGSYPLLNIDSGFNDAAAHNIGRYTSTGYHFNGYLADIYFIDGQALTPASFGQTDANGEWQPIAYTGTYGTNGFKLDFADNSAATAAALGKDTSGNGNNWTPNNLSVTAGAGNDSLVDTPTSYGTDTGVGGEVRGNYCTLNPLANESASGPSITNGNLSASKTAGTYNATAYSSVVASSGKWYFEATVTSGDGPSIGVVNTASRFVGTNITNKGTNSVCYSMDGQKWTNNVGTAFGATFTTGAILGCAIDIDSGKVWFHKNGSWQASGDPAAGTNPAFTGATGSYFLAVGAYSASYTYGFDVNFGQRPFAYPAPAGFKALCDTNLPTPTIVKPSTVMDVLTWTGSGALGRSFTGLGFSPDLVWGKIRSGNATWPYHLYDTVRGAGANKELHSNTSEAEGVTSTGSTGPYGYISSFDANGFTTSSTTANDYWNNASMTYAAWCWDAGSSTVTNTAGTISSQVRANASAGFSIVTYTGTGNTGLVGHGLGVTPGMIIVKARVTTINNDWMVYHSGLANPPQDALRLNSTGGPYTNNTYPWGSSITSTVFGVSPNSSYGISSSSITYVAYCFAPVAGYSAFGSYTGNGNANGPFVYTGFRPQWILIKQTTVSTITNWILFDARRIGYNPNNNNLNPNTTDAEFASALLDIVSNGFKIRSTSTDVNNNTGTYVYAAFAEFPFQYARAR